MEVHGRQRTRRNKAYRIVVRAELGERFAAAFEGMEVKVAEGRTIITGEARTSPTCTGSSTALTPWD